MKIWRPRRDTVLGPVVTEHGTVTLRTPRLRDATQWSAARLANRTWLEAAFPAWGDDWEAEQSPSAWVERCLHLRRQRRQGLHPFVVLLDRRLVGEAGIDAVDPRTNTGEGSTWAVRDHGGPSVMLAAILWVIRHAFTCSTPLDRVVSPVATTSRRGRSPGLTAVGFEIEATVPRTVAGELVEHDIWVIHNTPDVIADLERRLAALGDQPTSAARPGPPTVAEIRSMVPGLVRFTARQVRAWVRDRSTAERPATADSSVLRSVDPGTGTATLVPRDAGAGEDAVAQLRQASDDVANWAPGARRLEVLLSPAVEHLATGLPALGFAHIATYRPNPAGRGYAGEQVWNRTI